MNLYMKRSVKNFRAILSCVLVSALMTANVFAGEKVENTENIENDNGVRVITYDEAIDLATKENSSLKQISDTLNYINDTKSLMFAGSNYPMLPDDGSNYLVTAARFQQLSAVNSLNTQQRNLRLTQELTDLSIEAGVKGEMTTISVLEQNYELAKESLELSKEQLSQTSTMYRLGMVSWNDYEKAMKEVANQEQQIKQLEMSMEQEYNSFAKLLGIDENEEFQIEYNVEYEPVEKITDMDAFVNTKIKTDLALQMEKQNVDSASFGLNLFIDTGNGTDYNKQELDVKTAERNYADSVKAKENSIKNAYIGLQNTESERKVLENKLAQAKADYETAKVNYQVGNITKLQLDSAELAITQAEIALEQNTLTHDVNKFMLDNTCLLSGASSASSTQN